MSEEAWSFEGACQWEQVMEVGTVMSEESTVFVYLGPVYL